MRWRWGFQSWALTFRVGETHLQKKTLDWQHCVNNRRRGRKRFVFSLLSQEGEEEWIDWHNPPLLIVCCVCCSHTKHSKRSVHEKESDHDIKRGQRSIWRDDFSLKKGNSEPVEGKSCLLAFPVERLSLCFLLASVFLLFFLHVLLTTDDTRREGERWMMMMLV